MIKSPFSRPARGPRCSTGKDRGPRAGRLNGLLLVACLAAGPTTKPDLTAELDRLDALAARSTAVSADFRQEKFTPLLKKPLVSTGHVVARGGTSLWATAEPRRSTMRATSAEIRLYYPEQSTVEVYPVQGELAAVATGPLPRLADLRKLFAIAEGDGSTADTLSLVLTPATDALRQHVTVVRVRLDRHTGAVRRTETVDPDGDRTVMAFDHVDLHAAVTDADLALTVPAGTRETRPLAGTK